MCHSWLEKDFIGKAVFPWALLWMHQCVAMIMSKSWRNSMTTNLVIMSQGESYLHLFILCCCCNGFLRILWCAFLAWFTGVILMLLLRPEPSALSKEREHWKPLVLFNKHRLSCALYKQTPCTLVFVCKAVWNETCYKDMSLSIIATRLTWQRQTTYSTTVRVIFFFKIIFLQIFCNNNK